jgi:hypothetical protein
MVRASGRSRILVLYVDRQYSVNLAMKFGACQMLVENFDL